MSLILNLRGTHGSGKTYVSHKLILDYEHEALVEPEYVLGKHFTKPNCHAVEGNLFVVGRWKSGMDGIFPQEIVEEMIEYWAGRGTVIWENVMVSANIGRWATLSHRLEPVSHSVWAFMDTPLQTCIDRVFARRAEATAAGFNHRQTDGEVKLDVLSQHWRRCRRAAVRAFREGIDVRIIDHNFAYEQVHDMLIAEGNWEAPDGYVGSLSDSPAPQLTPWLPTEDEQEFVLKTSRFPWEPEDTLTKIDFVSAPRRKSRLRPDVEFGHSVRRWGAELEDSEDLGVTVQSWAGYQKLQVLSTLDKRTLATEEKMNES